MTTVRVSPPVVDTCDILEYARALIEEHGWRKGKRVPDSEEWDKVAQNGLSLHDAIGMACYRLSGEVGTNVGRKSRSSKDFPTPAIGGGLRSETTAAILKQLPRDVDDIRFNDAASDVSEILRVIDATIEEECS